VGEADFKHVKIYTVLFFCIRLLWYGENRTYYTTHHKPKLPIPELNVFTDDHVL